MKADSADLPRTAAVVVAHPDDETLWSGGLILSHPQWTWHVAAVCRASDQDRAPRFSRALLDLGAEGKIADLDDGPGQQPLLETEVRAAVLQVLPSIHFHLIVSHNPTGEYTRHRRHEEVSRAVISLWYEGRIVADELWTFAFEDGNTRYLPRPIEAAPIYLPLPEDIWQHKYRIITETYGFPKDGFEARTTPRAEAFWRFTSPPAAKAWLDQYGVTA